MTWLKVLALLANTTEFLNGLVTDVATTRIYGNTDGSGNMTEYIDRQAVLENLRKSHRYHARNSREESLLCRDIRIVNEQPAIDAVEVVRCYDCVHAVPLERNCELSPCLYMHCNLWRGEETRNVWHKYKRYYRDYSLVEHDDFCSSGERKDGEG